MSSINTQPNSLLGHRVIYKLTDFDVREIIQKRRGAGTATASGNDPREGDEFPAIIVKEFVGAANLQVFLDGTDVFWATSRSRFDTAAHGSWDGEAEAARLAAGEEPNPENWIPDAKGHWFTL